ncbi:hypothetical protein ACWDTT_28960 [Streptosporangium sandarakinum]
MLLLCVLLISGCGSWVFPGEELRVDPGVIRDIRNIGKVVAEAKVETPWDGTTTVTEVLIIDVGNSNAQRVIEKAVSLLQGIGWKIVDRRLPVEMTSDKWENTVLGLEGIDFYRFDELEAPQVEKAIKDARVQAMSEALVVLELHPVDG